MSRFTRVIIILLSLYLTNTAVSAQGTEKSRPEGPLNVITTSAGLFPIYGAILINYERYFYSHDQIKLRQFYFRAGYGRYSSWGEGGSCYVLGFSMVLGRSSHRLDASLGGVVYFDKEGYNIGVSNANYPYQGYSREPSRMDYMSLLPNATAGYRFQKPGGWFIFRAGIGIPEGIYIGLGFAF